MKARILPLAFIAVLLLAFGAFAAACGGGGGGSGGGGEPLKLEEYFQRLQLLSDDLNEPGGERLFLLEDFVGGMDDLNPPDQAGVAHNEAVEAGREISNGYESLFDQLEGVEAAADRVELFGELLEELFEGESFVDAGERFQQACLDLEEIARENDVEVDLSCEG